MTTNKIIIEVRAGAGGDEAAIFAGDLFRMYNKFAENRGWKVELVDYTEGTAGGYKEIIFNMTREYLPGEKFEGEVVRLMDFGAFVKIGPNAEGLGWPWKFSDAYKKSKNAKQRAAVTIKRIEHFIRTGGEE